MNKPIDKDYLTRQFTNFNSKAVKKYLKEGTIITLDTNDASCLPETDAEHEWVLTKTKKVYYEL